MLEGGLLGPQEIRRLADGIGLRPTKQRGQNFVVDANTIRRLVAAAELSEHDVVLEVGPGLGSLTLGLLQQARQVVAVEIDNRLAELLPRTVQEYSGEQAWERLTVVAEDALHIRGLPASEPTALVANLPYNVSVPVLLHLLEHFPGIAAGLVMVQLEVADRLVAKPGSKIYGAPSVKLAWYAQAHRAGNVSPAVFWPVPNVDSGLVRFQRRNPPDVEVPRSQVFAVIDAAFSQRRKMLRASLARLVGSSEVAASAIEAAGLDPTVRGERLDVGDFARLSAELVHRGLLPKVSADPDVR